MQEVVHFTRYSALATDVFGRVVAVCLRELVPCETVALCGPKIAFRYGLITMSVISGFNTGTHGT